MVDENHGENDSTDVEGNMNMFLESEDLEELNEKVSKVNEKLKLIGYTTATITVGVAFHVLNVAGFPDAPATTAMFALMCFGLVALPFQISRMAK